MFKHIAVADPIRTKAKDAITALSRQGLRVVMLTGDNQTIAQIVADAVGGLDGVHAELKPEDNARIVGELKARVAKIAMTGNGINNASALAAADVGLAMGTGMGRASQVRPADPPIFIEGPHRDRPMEGEAIATLGLILIIIGTERHRPK